MKETHQNRSKIPFDIRPDMPDKNVPEWLKLEMENLSMKLEKLNNQIANIPADSSLRNLRAMMKETAKALQMRIDELDELILVKPPTHKMISSKKD